MKKMLLLAALTLFLGAHTSRAEIRCRSLDNMGGTNIVLVDNAASADLKVTRAILINDGVRYEAKKIRCDIEEGVAVFRLHFKRLTKFKNCTVELTVDGKKVTVDLQQAMLQRE